MEQSMTYAVPLKEMDVGSLRVKIYANRDLLGSAAAAHISEKMTEILQQKGRLRMIFAAAPSQDETLARLIESPAVEWNRVTAFHMDEYIGLDGRSPQCFGRYLARHLFDRVPFAQVHYIDPNPADPESECARYTQLLQSDPVDIVCMGIGENGHIAFNDPPVADFRDNRIVKMVKLDAISRQQQVNDGCFNSLDEVPRSALSLTIPALLSAEWLFAMVPGRSKAAAVHDTLTGPIHEKCPASILRQHAKATLFLDNDSAASVFHEDR
jgi:glucosamine-6-phosphate deaminase